ncbi:unnamed protein product, partial [Chrysoparadoxa australica]
AEQFGLALDQVTHVLDAVSDVSVEGAGDGGYLEEAAKRITQAFSLKGDTAIRAYQHITHFGASFTALAVTLEKGQLTEVKVWGTLSHQQMGGSCLISCRPGDDAAVGTKPLAEEVYKKVQSLCSCTE